MLPIRRHSVPRLPLARSLKIRLRCRKISPWEDVDASIQDVKLLAFAAAGAFALTALAAPAQAQSGQPIKIGFGMALTGPLAANGKQALLGMKIWEEETNAKGGLLGRPVKLVFYDDQSNPSTVPGIYTKLLDVDKVDLVVGALRHQHDRAGDAGRDAEGQGLHRPVRRSMRTTSSSIRNTSRCCRPARTRSRRSPKASSRSAAAQNPKPQTVALVAADAEFSHNACEGARENAKKYGFKIVYDKTYPPSTTDFTPIVRAIQAANADIVIDLLLSARLGRHGARRVNELGLQAEDDRRRDGRSAGHRVQDAARPLLNGIVNYETWVPSEKLMTPAPTRSSRSIRRAPAPKASTRSATISAAGAMPISVLGQAIEGDQEHRRRQDRRLPPQDTIQDHHGRLKFGTDGEWAKSGMLQVQYHGIKRRRRRPLEGHELLRPCSRRRTSRPATLIYPYEKAK